jgi:hypothetical protein
MEDAGMTTLKSQVNGVPTMTSQHEANNDVKTRLVDALFAGDWDTMAGLVPPDVRTA